MAVIKCKMCGGDLELVPDATVCECEYCGTRQTVPTADNEKKLTLFSRAGRLLRACEFDKAAGVYESIIADFPQEAEAYWGLVLCKYGIEYVDDPATGKKIPTCHRSSFESVLDDVNYDQACENTDAVARRVYRDEARQIESLREAILSVSGTEEPYDVFISYKETDDGGERTVDSVLAQDIYRELTREGYRVFFSRISLENKLGTEYEPYIFAALNSAKVMLVVGTDYENLDAVWVKNEWSRFLKLIAKGEKKTLIPVFKDMDAYDMPKEFSKLAGLDMGKVGAMQDLLHGVEKIIPLKKPEPEPAAMPQPVYAPQTGGPNAMALQMRGQMALEDGNWDAARDFFNQVLNMNAENAEAWLGLAMADLRISREDLLGLMRDGSAPAVKNGNYQRFVRFAAPERQQAVKALLDHAETEKLRREKRAEQDRITSQKEATINKGLSRMRAAVCAPDFLAAAEIFASIPGWANADELAKQCRDRAAEIQAECEAFARELPQLRARIAPAQGLISAGLLHTSAVRMDGVVMTAGDPNLPQCRTQFWNGILSLSSGPRYTLGVHTNGTVYAVGDRGEKYDFGQYDVAFWSRIVQVAGGSLHTVGLREDGTVTAAGRNNYHASEVSEWTDIVKVAAGSTHTLGLRADGTVVATGDNENHCCETKNLANIVDIAAGKSQSYFLRADGVVLPESLGWRKIVAIEARYEQLFGLRADGTVVSKKLQSEEIASWTDVVAIAAGVNHVAALRADGTVVAAGDNEGGQCNVNGWRLFDHLEQFTAFRDSFRERAAEARKAEAERLEAERRRMISALATEANAIQPELKTIEVLIKTHTFNNGPRIARKNALEARLKEIQEQLEQLSKV